MKTPDEIKKGLKCLRGQCGRRVCKECELYVPGYESDVNINDALALIQQLERERDAAIRDIKHVCTRCIHSGHRFLADGKLDDRCGTCVHNGMCNWEWRGVQSCG